MILRSTEYWSLIAGRRSLVAVLLMFCGLCVPAIAHGQQIIEVQPVSSTGRILAPRLDGWQLDGSATELSPAGLDVSQPERGRYIREYGLRDVAFGTYRNTGTTGVRVEIFRMINFVAAYGAYSLERTAQAERVAVGTEGALDADRLGFFKGEFYVRLISEGAAPDREALLDLARELDKRVSPRHSEIPVLIRHLPADGLVPGTERFIAGPLALARSLGAQDPNDVLMLSSDAVEAALAEYGSGGGTSKLLVVEYHTPQLAATAHQQVRDYFQGLPEDERARRILKREGNYIIEAFDVRNHEAMQSIVDRVEYTPVIHWLKKNPLEDLQQFQSEPEVSLIDFYLAAFGFIGLSLVTALTGGVLLGTCMFLWRRWRQRRWPGYSDAGGMVRLNLDNIALPPLDGKPLKPLPGK
jgi:hypothetical protein